MKPMSQQPNKPAVSRVVRVDAAHDQSAAIPPATAPDQAVLQAVAGHNRTLAADAIPSADLQQQLERHATELGTQLQEQQRGLDRRQAEFNARLARVENELRAARIQQREREIELAERETEFQTRWQILQDQTTDVATAELALQEERQEDRLHESYNRDQIKDALARWKVRLQELDRCELQLQAQLEEVANEREQMQQQRTDLDAERAAMRLQTASDRKLMKQRMDKQVRTLHEQAERVERRKRSLEQLHADVMRMYREALEMRICTEELWGRLSDRVSPARLTTKVSKLRRKLTDQFHLAKQSLADQRDELQELVNRLESQQSTIGQRRDRLQRWQLSRQTEIERQAARLVAREQELDKQQANIGALETHWDQQRRQYEQTIRELRRQIVVSGGPPMLQ